MVVITRKALVKGMLYKTNVVELLIIKMYHRVLSGVYLSEANISCNTQLPYQT
jgi:hypothetical protein